MSITQEQKTFRRDKIGGSDAPVIMGVDSYGSKPKLWLRIKGMLPEQPEGPVNKVMEFGTRAEPIVAQALAEQLGEELVECDTMTHPKYPFLVGHPDRLVKGKKIGVEIKTCGIFRKHLWEDDKGETIVPSAHVIQAAHYMMLSNCDSWIIACLIHGVKWDMRVATIQRDRELESMILEAEVNFWREYIEGGKEPPLDSDPGCLEYLKIRYPRSCEKILVADNDRIQRMLIELQESFKRVDEAEAVYSAAKAQVQGYMQDASCLQWPEEGLQISWKNNKDRCDTDWKGLAESLLEKMAKKKRASLLAKFAQTKPGARVFRVTDKQAK